MNFIGSLACVCFGFAISGWTLAFIYESRNKKLKRQLNDLKRELEEMKKSEP